MAELKRSVIRFCVFLLILEGVTSVWEFIDIMTYGESQQSAADAIAAIIMTNCIHRRIWRRNDNA